MNSYWIESIKQKKKEFPKLEENKKADVCIIGGGLTGITTAYYLSKTKMKVVLLEKSQLSTHTTRKLHSKNNKPTWAILRLFANVSRKRKSKTILRSKRRSNKKYRRNYTKRTN